MNNRIKESISYGIIPDSCDLRDIRVELEWWEMGRFITGWINNGRDRRVLNHVKMIDSAWVDRVSDFCVGQNLTLQDIYDLEGVGCVFDKSATNYVNLKFGVLREIGTTNEESQI